MAGRLALVLGDQLDRGGAAFNGFDHGRDRPLFSLASIRAVGASTIPGYEVAPDGRPFVFAQYPDTELPPPPSQIHIVLNWFEELKGRVPTR